jgi:transcription antitermination protein NusB
MANLTQQKSREITLQILFALDQGGEGRSVCALIQEELKLSKEEVAPCFEKVRTIRETKEEIDRQLGTLSEKYPFSRIAFLDRNILRLALYEFMCGELPPKVVLSEAIRLARKFGGPQSGKFINALLDSYLKKTETIIV